MRKQKCLEETRGNHKMVGGGRTSELFSSVHRLVGPLTGKGFA